MTPRRAFMVATVILAALAIEAPAVCAGPNAHAGLASSLNVRRATLLAATLANAATQRRYGIAPFAGSSAMPQLIHGRWQWHATAGYGHTDLLACVSFSRNGVAAETSVEQLILPQW